MLLAHGAPGDSVPGVLSCASVHGPLVVLELNDEELDQFMAALKATAEGARNIDAMQRLGSAHARIEAGLAGKWDPGWHMLRPALGRLDITRTQAQYIAFIHSYSRVHRRSPAEADLQAFFQTAAPSVHGVLKALERRGFISRVAGVGRSMKVLLSPDEIPELE
ncbi:MAG: LexA family protein [Gemmatimonadaceae bacterium]